MDVEAPPGMHGTLRLRGLPEGVELPDELVVEAVLKVIHHPKRGDFGDFHHYRLVGRLVRPALPLEE